MYCYHCECDLHQSLVFETKSFCSTACKNAWLRDFITPDLRRRILNLKMKSEEISALLEKDRSKYREFELEVCEKAKSKYKDFDTEFNSFGRYKKSFLRFAETIAFGQLQKKTFDLEIKLIGYLLDRNMKMYALFKEKLVSEWDTLLSMSRNDGMALSVASAMSTFYKYFEKIECAFAYE